MNRRGFACLGLVNPKTPENIGGALRAADCYGVSQVNITGTRSNAFFKHGSNTQRTERHTPIFHVSDPLQYVAHDTQIVAIDLINGAKPLQTFCHPERALYVFGPEDGTLGRDVTDKADHVVYVPTRHCMNLACCINVVLYDRLAKGGAFLSEYGRAAD